MTPDPAFLGIGPLPQKVTWRGALVLARDDDARILMQLRDDRPGIAAPGLWCLFGGAVEEGETLRAAACREFLEETGIALDAHRLEPRACFASQHVATGLLHVFATPERVHAHALRLGEGAGYGLLTPRQVRSYPVLEILRDCLIRCKEI